MSRCLLGIPFLLFSCIQGIELPVREQAGTLVVEGFITDQEGPYTMRLSRSATYQSVFARTGVIEPETRANVSIRTATGDIIVLAEIGDGYYKTPASFRGVLGESYSLNINTQLGEELVSSSVCIPAGGTEIEDLILRFERHPSVDEFEFTTGMNIFASFADDPVGPNFYLAYTSHGVFPWSAHPELAELNPNFPCPTGDSIRCFRYERDYFQPNLRPVQRCFVPETRPFDFRLISDQFQNGAQVTALAAFIEDDGRRFEYSYRVRVNLLTISPEAFGFYQRLASQLSIEGDIFDPPPAQILGNIVNINDPSASPIGYFGAYHASSAQTYIEREQLEIKQPKLRWAGECTALDSSTIVKPVDWTGSSW